MKVIVQQLLTGNAGPSRDRLEAFPPSCQELWVWSGVWIRWQGEMHTLESLKSMPEHRAVMFPQDRVTNLNYVVRSNAYDKLIERGVMESAECYPVGNHRLPTGLPIRNNVCSLKKLSVPQSTKRTLFSIGF